VTAPPAFIITYSIHVTKIRYTKYSLPRKDTHNERERERTHKNKVTKKGNDTGRATTTTITLPFLRINSLSNRWKQLQVLWHIYTYSDHLQSM
jgi:hypothetical protein